MVEVPIKDWLSLEEVSRRGNARYEELRERVEAEHWNRYIAIDAETGDYAIADRSGAAMRLMHAKYPEGQSYLRKIGDEPEPGLAERIFGAGPLSGATVRDRKD